MKKIITLIMSFAVILTTMTGCSNSSSNENYKKSKVNNLDFDFEVNPETFELSSIKDGTKEVVSQSLKEREVSNLKKTKDIITWTYPDDSIDVEVRKKDTYLDVKIKSTSPKESEFEWPKVDGESYTLPINEGKFIPSNDKYWKKFLDNSVYNVIESFSMQFFAVNNENNSIVYIIDNKFNNEIEFNTKDRITFKFKHEYPSINKNKEYGFRIYMTENNVGDIAKTYKNYIIEKNEFKSLKEKAKSNKNIEKLYGSPHIYFWDKSIITANDIKWDKLKSELSNDFINHIKNILSKVEGGNEMIQVFDVIKNQDYIDKYQMQQIINAFNSVMLSKDFYNPLVFTNSNAGVNKILEKKIDNLNKTELIELNKRLLKTELKNSTKDVDSWAKYNTINVIDEISNSGIKNAWIGFDDIESGYVSPKLVEKAKDVGYLVGPYDSYHSIHEPGKEKWSTAKFEDSSLYENATIEDKDGKKLSGFQGEGRKLNPTLSLSSVENRVNKILKDEYGFNSWFIDCDATGEIYDDYSNSHITTQKQDLEARLKRMSYIRDKAKVVIGSEGGNDFASETIAFAHGIETPAFSWVDPDMNKNKDSKYYVGRYYSPTGGVPEVFSKQVPVKDLYKKVFVDETYSLPLFRLVYNDSVVTSHQWLWGTFKIEDELNSRMMKEILYNIAPMYHIDRTEWEKHKNDIVSHTKIWSEFNKKAIKEEMIEFKFLSEDRLIQMSKFGNDLKVIANFSNKDYKYEGDFIKANSLIIYEGIEKTIYTPNSK